MGINTVSKDLIIVDLPLDQFEISDDLQALNELVNKNSSCDVIIDFLRVELLTSSSLSNLLILRNLLAERKRQLFLCNVAPITKYIFVVAGLKDDFNFIDNQSAALAAAQNSA